MKMYVFSLFPHQKLFWLFTVTNQPYLIFRPDSIRPITWPKPQVFQNISSKFWNQTRFFFIIVKLKTPISLLSKRTKFGQFYGLMDYKHFFLRFWKLYVQKIFQKKEQKWVQHCETTLKYLKVVSDACKASYVS